MLSLLKDTANLIIDLNPAIVPRYRILRDVLKIPSFSQELIEARNALKRSGGVHELQEEQRDDGSWGAFHSRSTKLKQRIPSTEVGVERSLSLGLDSEHLILQMASEYIIRIMSGEIIFPDYHEKNDRWQTGMRLFLASTLSLIDPGNSILDAERQLWLEILSRSFQSGVYSANDESKAHADLTGATVKGSYLVLNNRYQINLLTSVPTLIPIELQRYFFSWIWSSPEGIGYLDIPLNRTPLHKPGRMDRWLASLELLCRFDRDSTPELSNSIEWIWSQRQDSGLWDFGSRPSSIAYLPMSDNWRYRINRTIDWSTRILCLLREYYDIEKHC